VFEMPESEEAGRWGKEEKVGGEDDAQIKDWQSCGAEEASATGGEWALPEPKLERRSQSGHRHCS
jgi:hypothetical protein